MKVLLFNGSPHADGCTNRALVEIAKTLKEENINSEIYQIGNKGVLPCKACYACRKIGKCVIDDEVNAFVDYACGFDGFIFGSPVHYASASGSITAFLDRAFFVNSSSGKKAFEFKPASAIASARRAGTTATLDQLNKYFTITQMPIISGRYWNMVHGAAKEDIEEDLEGLQNMRFLARNMAWFLKLKEAGEKAGVELPKQEKVIYTNFVR